ncbi:MAG: TetR/AcrR family transcriptional regulator [Mycobacteriaceae bacterium]
MEKVKRTRLSPQDRQEQLITLGLEMLAERSIEQVSVEEIADQAGVSRGLLFHYFSSKQDFLLSIVRKVSEDMLTYTTPDLTLEPLDTLRVSLSAYVDYISENGRLYVALLRGAAGQNAQFQEVFEYNRSQVLERVLAVGERMGIERSNRIILSVRGWIALVEETAISWLKEPVISREELLDTITLSLPAVIFAPQLISSELIKAVSIDEK